jgi:hypothetical protein
MTTRRQFLTTASIESRVPQATACAQHNPGGLCGRIGSRDLLTGSSRDAGRAATSPS